MKTAKPYQTAGAEFLTSGGVLLADEPGLGKTLQAIEACKRVDARRILIICPAVALAVWRDEIRDCWPEQNPIYLRDADESPDFNALLGAGPVDRVCLITGYEYLLVNKKAQQVVLAHGMFRKFDVLICDEAHALKSPAAQRTILIYGAGCAGGTCITSFAERTWLLTGTPQLNHPGEWFPHLRCLAPERIPAQSYQGFVARYCMTGIRTVRIPARSGRPARSTTIAVINGANREQLPDLAKRLRGFWLRRRAVDVLGELPPLEIVTRTLAPDACDPKVLAKIENSEEAQLLRDAIESGDVDELKKVEGQVSRLRKLFALAKVGATVSWVESLFDQGIRKVGVWGWHVDALAAVAERLKAHGVVTITGATRAAQRGELVKAFQDGPARVFVGQIQAAGTAITLTAANRVVFLEQAWTPALNHQAAKRHHRIGQTKPVLAEVLAIDGSIDQAVAAILTRKANDISLLENVG